MHRTKHQKAMHSALGVARFSALAAFNPSPVTLEQFERLQAPFKTKDDRTYARALCTAIALEARIDSRRLTLSDMYVVCAIAVHRHRLRLKTPPAYTVYRNAEM